MELRTRCQRAACCLVSRISRRNVSPATADLAAARAAPRRRHQAPPRRPRLRRSLQPRRRYLPRERGAGAPARRRPRADLDLTRRGRAPPRTGGRAREAPEPPEPLGPLSVAQRMQPPRSHSPHHAAGAAAAPRGLADVGGLAGVASFGELQDFRREFFRFVCHADEMPRLTPDQLQARSTGRLVPGRSPSGTLARSRRCGCASIRDHGGVCSSASRPAPSKVRPRLASAPSGREPDELAIDPQCAPVARQCAPLTSGF